MSAQKRKIAVMLGPEPQHEQKNNAAFRRALGSKEPDDELYLVGIYSVPKSSGSQVMIGGTGGIDRVNLKECHERAEAKIRAIIVKYSDKALLEKNVHRVLLRTDKSKRDCALDWIKEHNPSEVYIGGTVHGKVVMAVVKLAKASFSEYLCKHSDKVIIVPVRRTSLPGPSSNSSSSPVSSVRGASASPQRER